MKSKKRIIGSLLLSLIFAGCATSQIERIEERNGLLVATSIAVSYEAAMQRAYGSGNDFCLNRGEGFAVVRHNQIDDNTVELFFNCYNVAEQKIQEERDLKAAQERRAREEATEAESKRKEAAERQRAWAELEDLNQKYDREIREKRESLRKRGILEASVLDLIVNYDTYKGKKILVWCDVYLATAGSALCRDESNGRQVLNLDTSAMDKDSLRSILIACSGVDPCRAMGIIGTMIGTSTPALKAYQIYKDELLRLKRGTGRQ